MSRKNFYGAGCRFFAVVCASLLVQVPVLKASGTQYTATLIATDGMTTSTGYDINDSGDVVGQMTVSSQAQAFLYSNGTVSLLGTLGGNSSVAYGINNAGQIVGQSATGTSVNPALTAFLYSNGEMISLGMPTPDDSPVTIRASAAVDINDSGQVAMWSQHSNGVYSSYVYHSAAESPTPELIPFGGRNNVRAIAINNHGVVVGSAQSLGSNGGMTAFRYQTGSGGEIGEVGRLWTEDYYGPKEGLSGNANAINDHDVIVGDTLLTSGLMRGFVRDRETGNLLEITPLRGELEVEWSDNTYANDINNAGQIVGLSHIRLEVEETWQSTLFTHAYLLDGEGKRDLNDLIVNDLEGVILENAVAINNWGQIVALTGGNISTRQTYLLNPLSFVTAMTTEGDASTLNIKAIAGMQYSAYDAPEAPEGSFVAGLIGGEAGAQRDVFLTYTGQTAAEVIGEIISLTGTGDDLFVLRLSYDPALAEALDVEALVLGWLDPEDGMWKNAVEGNSDDFSEFVLGAFDPDEHLVLGTYGVDTINHNVWAVLDHNSQFAVIPEPSTWVCLFLGGAGLILWSRRRTLRA